MYILHFTNMLYRVCLLERFQSRFLFRTPIRSEKPWSSIVLTKALQKYTRGIYGRGFGFQTYRQLAIAVTERHMKQNIMAFDCFNDRLYHANVDVASACQSGHRQFERLRTYGLDGAFPASLQPAPLRAYR